MERLISIMLYSKCWVIPPFPFSSAHWNLEWTPTNALFGKTLAHSWFSRRVPTYSQCASSVQIWGTFHRLEPSRTAQCVTCTWRQRLVFSFSPTTNATTQYLLLEVIVPWLYSAVPHYWDLSSPPLESFFFPFKCSSVHSFSLRSHNVCWSHLLSQLHPPPMRDDSHVVKTSGLNSMPKESAASPKFLFECFVSHINLICPKTYQNWLKN